MKTPSPNQSHKVLAAVALLAVGVTFACQADPIKSAFSVPAKIDATINSGCDNSEGPSINIAGSIRLDGFKSKMIFKNNQRGKRTANVVTDYGAVLVPIGGAFSLPKQPSEGGVGGNPYIYIQFRDSQSNALTDEMLLGRCVQGLSISPEVFSQIASSTDVQIEDCSNKSGPNITIGCDITISGIIATFTFRNNEKGTHTAEVTTEVSLIAEGSTVTFPKRRAHGGVGRNPIIGLQLLRDTDEPMCDPIILGRCNKL